MREGHVLCWYKDERVSRDGISTSDNESGTTVAGCSTTAQDRLSWPEEARLLIFSGRENPQKLYRF